jgi:threonine 3-dehydrogenase
VIFKGLEIIGLGHRAMFETWYKMVALIQSGLHISPLITHHFKVDDLNKGLTR